MKLFSGTGKQSGSDFLRSFTPLDKVTAGYILLSGLYIAIGSSHLQDIGPHFGVRIGILGLIVALAFLYSKFPNKLFLFLRNLYPLIFLGFFYTETSFMKNIIIPDNLDPAISWADELLFGCQPSLVFSKNMPHHLFNELMNVCYFSYYLITSAICITLYLVKPAQSYKSVFIVVFSFYMYYALYAVFPVVGPQYHWPQSGEVPAPHLFGKIMHYILSNFEEPTGAFPSSHVGISMILSFIAFRHLKKAFYISLPFVLGICFATVYLKAHYLVDVIAGIISVPVFILISSYVYEKLSGSAVNKSDL